MSEPTSQAELIGELLRGAIPVSPAPPTTTYVTREEFDAKVETIETKIENEASKTKLWIAIGVIGTIGSFGGGYVSLITRIDRISEALPALVKVQEGRREWIQRQDQRDGRQDIALQRLDRAYQPLPYQAPPQ